VIAIVDYGSGNLRSVWNMLRKVSDSVVITSDPAETQKADKLVIPGVGSFDSGMENLRRTGLLGLLEYKVLLERTPVLGICLGMQLMARSSEEGGLPGLGWLDAEVVRFKFPEAQRHLKIPHMGWSEISLRKDHPLFLGVEENFRFYFVHAYHLQCGHTDGIVVKSEELRQALPRGIDLSRARLIPNGIDLGRFRPLERLECQRKLGWEPDTFHVLFPTADRSAWDKRLPLAEAALAALNEMGHRSEMHGLPGIPHEEVPVWMNAADVLLLTSDHEGSPNVVKEALGCNRPVVSVDVGDVRERIQSIEGCFLAEPTPMTWRPSLPQCMTAAAWSTAGPSCRA
jgi:glutamine amidotransferase